MKKEMHEEQLPNKFITGNAMVSGNLICQKANREKVEWTPEGFNKPMGVSTYTDNLMRMVEKHLDALQVVTDKHNMPQ